MNGFTTIVIINNTTGTNFLKCTWSLPGGPEKNGEDMVDNLERGLSKTRREASGEKEWAALRPIHT